MLEGTLNELVGIYKLRFYCCPMDRSDIGPVSPPDDWDRSGDNAQPEVGADCTCKNGDSGTIIEVEPELH